MYGSDLDGASHWALVIGDYSVATRELLWMKESAERLTDKTDDSVIFLCKHN